VVIYGTGSPLLVDVEESLFRAGIPVRAGIRNRTDGKNFLSAHIKTFEPQSMPDDLTECPFIAPLFTPGNRQQAAKEAESRGFKQPLSLVDPSVVLPRVIRFDPGLYVNVGCTLGAASDFGPFVLINRGAGVGHHAHFASFVSIGPGAVIGGQVTIGKGSLVGAGAIVLPAITIGENVVVAAGAVVTHDVPSRSLVIGNPGRVVKSGIAGYNGQLVL
jgi:hypothetical protein